MSITTEFKITTGGIDNTLKNAENKVQQSANKMKKSFDKVDNKKDFGQGLKQNIQGLGKGFEGVNKLGGKTGGLFKNLTEGLGGLTSKLGLLGAGFTIATTLAEKFWDKFTINNEEKKNTIDFFSKMSGKMADFAIGDLSEADKKIARIKEIKNGQTKSKNEQLNYLLQSLGFSIGESETLKQRMKTEDFQSVRLDLRRGHFDKVRQEQDTQMQYLKNSINLIEDGEQKVDFGDLRNYESAQEKLNMMMSKRGKEYIVNDEKKAKALESQIEKMLQIVSILKERKKIEEQLQLDALKYNTQKENEYIKVVDAYNNYDDEVAEEEKKKNELKKKIKLENSTDKQKVGLLDKDIKDAEARIKVLKNKLQGLTSQHDELIGKAESTSDMNLDKELTEKATKKLQKIKEVRKQIIDAEMSVLNIQNQKQKVQKKIAEQNKKNAEQKLKKQKELKKQTQQRLKLEEQKKQKQKNDIRKMFSLMTEEEELKEQFSFLDDKQISILMKAKKMNQKGEKLSFLPTITNQLTARGGFKGGAFTDNSIQNKIAQNTRNSADNTKKIEQLLKNGGII